MFNILVDVRNKLEKLSLTQAWSLREADLYDYQRQLDKIDESRVDGNFIDEDGNPADLYVQRVSLLLPRPRCPILLTRADMSLPDPTELWLHLLSDGLL